MFQDLTQIHKMYLVGYVPHLFCVSFQFKEMSSLDVFQLPSSYKSSSFLFFCFFVSKLKRNLLVIFLPTVLKQPSHCPFLSSLPLSSDPEVYNILSLILDVLFSIYVTVFIYIPFLKVITICFLNPRVVFSLCVCCAYVCICVSLVVGS